MARIAFGEAIDAAVARAMAADERIVLFGEDVPSPWMSLPPARGARPAMQPSA
jgi:pyruvate/2-oxoglutarate/acetoin dehydrogenase E1 component